MPLLCAVDSARVRATIFVVIAQKYLGHQPWWAINHHIPSKITSICGKTAKRSWGIKRANFPKPFWDIHKIAKAKTTSGSGSAELVDGGQSSKVLGTLPRCVELIAEKDGTLGKTWEQNKIYQDIKGKQPQKDDVYSGILV